MYYEYYCLDRTEEVPTDYKEISFVCLRPDGCLELPTTLGTVCRKVAKTLEGFEGFHFHQLRHTYTSNLLANGADVYKRQVLYHATLQMQGSFSPHINFCLRGTVGFLSQCSNFSKKNSGIIRLCDKRISTQHNAVKFVHICIAACYKYNRNI